VSSLDQRILDSVDQRRLVKWAVEAVSTPSFTGEEQAMGEFVAETCRDLGLQVQWQEVEEGRPNVLATWEGVGGGPSLMLNGHMDTSYSGRESWLAGIAGFQPEGFVEDGRVYGLGISNMKGALACYVEALHALHDAGVRLRGDVLLAAVCGEIEKAQWGDAQGAEFRGYATGSRYLVSHGGVADACILGEPTEGKIVLGHFGSLWLRISTSGNFIHTAFSEGKRGENSILRMREVIDAVLEWIPSWEADPENAYRGARAVVNVGAIGGGFGWRVSRTPHRTDLFLDVRVPPTKPMATARRDVLELGRSLRGRFPDYGIETEVYVSAPGSEIDEDHPVVSAIDVSHAAVFGAAPDREVTRWFSDASVLARYGIASVNYGTSSGLPDPELGENLDIDGLVKTAGVYALAAARYCGVAE
jgi:acetylornithine deacetylase/succinyl-diaminopimelate desuccinylase-like protein